MSKILVVDDSEASIRLQKVILESLGNEVALVRNGEEAVKDLEKNTYDIIIIDYMMEGMTGIELAAVIHTMDQHLQTPLVLLTAYLDDMLITRAEQVGFVGCLSKSDVSAGGLGLRLKKLMSSHLDEEKKAS